MGEVEQAVKVIDHAANAAAGNQGPWWMFIAMLAVNLVTNWLMYKFFVGQLVAKDKLIACFAVSEDRLAKAINLQNETELLRLAASPHVDDVVKYAAAKRIQALQEERKQPDANPNG